MLLKHFPMFCLLAMLWSCSDSVTRPTSAPVSSNEVPASNEAAWQQEMLQAVNQLRSKGCRCGSEQMAATSPLKWSDLLQQAAEIHVNDMEANNFFDHEGSDQSTVSSRATRVGYDWSGIAENIAQGHTTVSQVVQSWKNSPGHCKNMMNPQYTELGAAKIDRTWVQVLGRPF